MFVTNAGNALRSAKAETLTKWLGVKVGNDETMYKYVYSVLKQNVETSPNFC